MAREAAQAHLRKAGQIVGNPYAKHVSRRPTTRDNTLSQVRSRQQASAKATLARADAAAAALPGGRFRDAPQRLDVADLPPGWSAAHIPPSGPTYYFNAAGVPQWAHPTQAPASILRSGEPVWRPVLQEATGAVYWWHVGDGRVQWSMPAEVDIPGLAAVQSMMALQPPPSAPPLPTQVSAPAGSARGTSTTLPSSSVPSFMLPPLPTGGRGPPMPAPPAGSSSSKPPMPALPTQGAAIKASRWGPTGSSDGGVSAVRGGGSESAPKRPSGDAAQ